jgi:hypothetical protein
MKTSRFLRHWLPSFLLLVFAGPLRCGALDLGAPTSRTPYDSYLDTLWTVMRRLGSAQPDIDTVEKLVREGRGFRYVFKSDEPYRPQAPEQTESTRSGDCKAKSLWLASKMDTRKVRFVIGKAKQVANVSHAWLIWESPEGWLILDATLYSRPLDPDRLSVGTFIPKYSYSPAGKFSHAVAAAPSAGKYGDHL